MMTWKPLVIKTWALSYAMVCFSLAQSLSTIAQIEKASPPHVEEKSYESLRWLVEYIRIPSESGTEKSAGEYLKARCLEVGLHVENFGEEDGCYNFIASLYPLDCGKPNIAMLHHIDVVPSGEASGWVTPPYEGLISAGQVWGRGAFDNKGSGIMQLAAMARMVRSMDGVDSALVPYNVSLLAMSCEETQCEGGARYVVGSHLDKLHLAAVVGEGPPSLKALIQSKGEEDVFGIAIGQKKAIWLRLSLTIETSGHGSTPPLSYANQEMVKALNRLVNARKQAILTPSNVEILRSLGEVETGLKAFMLRRPRIFAPIIQLQLRKHPEIFALFSNTVTITSIRSPEIAHNAIPSSVECLLDCRMLPEEDEAHFIQWLYETLDHPGIIIETIMKNEPSPLSDPDHFVYHKLSKAVRGYYGEGTRILPVILPNYNDSGIFRAAGVPAYDIIPVHVEREHLKCVHQKNERLPILALSQGADVYYSFIRHVMDLD